MIAAFKNLSPAQTKWILSIVGSVIASLPFSVSALEPYAPIFVGLGSALGGAAWFRRPGDVKGAR